jgi:hypothetical protein
VDGGVEFFMIREWDFLSFLLWDFTVSFLHEVEGILFILSSYSRIRWGEGGRGEGKTYVGGIRAQVVEDIGPISQVRSGERKCEHVGGGDRGTSVKCVGDEGGGCSDVVEEGYITGRLLEENYKHLV